MGINRLLERDRSATNCVRVLTGTLQRINYLKKELTVIADGEIWNFAVDADCKFWFDDQAVILRCFHPLDQVRVEFHEDEPRHSLRAMYGWERVPQKALSAE